MLSGGSHEEISNRFGQARACNQKLQGILRCTKITNKVKVPLNKVIVKTIGTYVAKEWKSSSPSCEDRLSEEVLKLSNKTGEGIQTH